MNWLDIACIVFACTAVNHLGLIAAIEGVTGFRLPVVNCCKCLTFWCVLAYCTAHGEDMARVPAISLLCSYAATWVELSMGIVDYYYNKTYDKIYPTDEDKPIASGTEQGDSVGTMS